MADRRFAQFATSDSNSAFWSQKVFFDSVPRRRYEIVPTLAHTPGMTERAARMLLATAQVADGTPPIAPPWFTGAMETNAVKEMEEDDKLLDEQIEALEGQRAHIMASETSTGQLSEAAQQQVTAINRKLLELEDRRDNY